MLNYLILFQSSVSITRLYQIGIFIVKGGVNLILDLYGQLMKIHLFTAIFDSGQSRNFYLDFLFVELKTAKHLNCCSNLMFLMIVKRLKCFFVKEPPRNTENWLRFSVNLFGFLMSFKDTSGYAGAIIHYDKLLSLITTYNQTVFYSVQTLLLQPKCPLKIPRIVCSYSAIQIRTVHDLLFLI